MGPQPRVVDGITHGVKGYRSQYCRCPVCVAGNSAQTRRERADRAARLAADPTLAPHGVADTYDSWGCRCAPCTAATAEARAGRRARAALVGGEQ